METLLPLLSVVIPAYNVPAYLRQAVGSVADAPQTEVIVVDDRSTDATGRIADELAETHATVTVIRPEHNGGLGKARNLGLAHATGDYVLFLDGDDYFVPGALEAIQEVIAEHHPDIIQFGYARLYPNGNAEEGVKRAPLQIEGTFVAKDQPEIYEVLNVAWNKAYRREFLAETGLQFPVGYYEDIPWTYPVLSQASSIVGVDRALYMYRQRGAGSILRSTDRRHLEILDQFERLMSELDRLGVEGDERAHIFTCAFRNIATLLTTQQQRIPAEERSRFYDRAKAAVKKHAPSGWTPPTEGDKAQALHWIWTSRYPVFRAQVEAREAYHVARKQPQRALGLAKRLGRVGYHHRRAYDVLRRTAAIDDNLVVFEALWGMSPRLNCLAIAREIQRTHPDKRIMWLVKPTEVPGVPEGVDYAVRDTHKYYRALATAKHVFVDANPPTWWRKRDGQVLTQLFHGTPLKYMGVEERGKTPAWRDALLRRCAQWDYAVASNSYSSEVWKHSYPVRCEMLEVGYPRNDVLVNADDEAKSAARTALGIDPDARVFLYAPTFRDGGMGAAAGLDLRALQQNLEADDVFLVRGHYFHGRQASIPGQGQILDMSAHPAVEDLYAAADVLITDYSSVMFDFANLRRPIIVFPYDWELYSQVRGTYFDITVDAPGEVVWTTAELADALATRRYESDENRARLEKFADIFTDFETGHAARDIVARVVDGAELPAREHGPVPVLRSWSMDRSS
ncbi:bifunctional glycosyltransferase family 2 protein/CDP-glycerol:glycerophosphate glycerophosphotransferase [Demequina sp. NBRC 110051]|uniref:bifunctional glycosyltransferase/CDP-glycerol:glycerophosphate glycerophosphotransferase n=1 Tax=Demequina sp. NBRC 110051 TaxID=1570340 RepID=UPI0009FED991|nr:bifunctional glycosyltransferase family 2 protein/CDP-glycerol:glycerophosphate glycerophosphotransferase [Demequina sp. NBRC 110051]